MYRMYLPLLGKNCVRICIQNLLHISADVSGPLLAEVAVAVFSFIRDTYPLSPALFIEFDTNNETKWPVNLCRLISVLMYNSAKGRQGYLL